MEDLWSDRPPAAAARDDAAGLLIRLSGIGRKMRARLEQERSRWFLWVPVLLAVGIAIYFHLPKEPPIWSVAILGALAAAFLLVSRRPGASLFAVTFALILSGIVVAKVRTLTAGPGNMIMPVSAVETGGWLEQLQFVSDGNRHRLFIVPIKIEGVDPLRLPRRIQLTWRGRKALKIQPGDYVKARVRFLKTLEPAWPGGYDPGFPRWYQAIGATGVLLGPPERIATTLSRPAALTWRVWVEQARAAVTKRLRAGLAGTPGAIAAALITGDRSAIPDENRDHLRAAGLAHLLAISGLHMALFAGGVFWLIRALLALSPMLATDRPIKKWAAVLAMLAAGGYLLLSGSGIATQRAFIMITIMFIAILFDRPALTMRNIALAALVILLFRPENLMSVSFQLSFVAVIALVALFEFLEDWRTAKGPARPANGAVLRALRRILDYFFRIGITTLVAGLSTAPVAAFHFNRVAAFSLLGNLLAVPLVGSIVMPAAIFALAAMPFGLESWPLAIMGQGIELVLKAARMVAGLPGAVRYVPVMSEPAGLAIALGLLWLFLWRRLWRLAGLAIAAGGIILGHYTQMPDLIVAASGKQVGLRLPDGQLAFSSKRAGKYVAERWLLKFGDGTSFKQAAMRKGFTCDRHGCTGHLRNGQEVAIVKHPAILTEECHRAAIVIATFRFRSPCPSALKIITPKTLKAQGVQALYLDKTAGNLAIKTLTARTRRGDRPWTVAPERLYRKPSPPAPAEKKPPKLRPGTPPGKSPEKPPPLQVRI